MTDRGCACCGKVYADNADDALAEAYRRHAGNIYVKEVDD